MRHEDEFNSSSYIPPKGDSFEFGSVYAKNDAEIVKENAALKTDFNSTKTGIQESQNNRPTLRELHQVGGLPCFHLLDHGSLGR